MSKVESMNMQQDNSPPNLSAEASTDDKHFLLSFIMGTYLGPDVRADVPRRSALQRLTEGLPPYNFNDLDLSYVTLPELESLYYYHARHADPSMVLKPCLLHMYFKGNLPLPSSDLSDWRQFTSFFPLKLHEQIEFDGKKIITGIVFIVDPDKLYIKNGDIERFGRLTGIYDLKIDLNKVFKYDHGYQKDGDESEQYSIRTCVDGVKKRRLSDPMQMQVPSHITPKWISNHRLVEEKVTCNMEGPAMMTLVATPSVEGCNLMSSMNLTGTARVGRAGPPLGLVDIGISKMAYLFQVALPGIDRNHGYLNCEIECDGKVNVRGMTVTGERSVKRHLREFHMKTQHLCPPGPFAVSFWLPGPVDPRLAKSKLRSDGILEVVVIKDGMVAVPISSLS